MLFGLALIACEEAPTDTVVELGPLDRTWVATIVRDPQAFTDAIADDRPGWILVHRHGLEGLAGQPTSAGARASDALADLHDDLARIEHHAWLRLGERWEERTGLPEGSALAFFVGLSAWDAGDTTTARGWFHRAGGATDDDVRAAAEVLADSSAGNVPPPEGNFWLQRVQAHLDARAMGDAGELADGATRPVLREHADDHERVFHDPMAHRTLAATHRATAGQASGLQALLFSGCPTLDDLKAEGCEPDLTFSALGLETGTADTDDAEAARAWVRALDAVLDPWAAELEDEAGDEGRELLGQLRLVPGFRAQVLLDRARSALLAAHPRQARAYAQLALDLEHPREVSPINAPGLYAALAEANLRTGHTREALDALQVLSDLLPTVSGVDELVGDLAVLEGLDRQGDSKEN